MKTKRKSEFKTKLPKFIKKLNTFRFLNISLYALLGILLFLALFDSVKPEKLDAELFSVSDTTIYAPVTVEDKEATERRKQEAYDTVEDQYTLRRDYSDNRVDLASSIFDSITEVNREADEKQKEDQGPASGETQGGQVVISVDERYQNLSEKLTTDINEKLSKEVFIPLLNATPQELALARDAVVTTVNNVMGKEIPVEELSSAKEEVREELQYTPIRSEVLASSAEIGVFAVIPNYVFDPQGTDEKRQQAADSVQEVQIKQGQILVEENELISREVYRKLELVGLLNNTESYKPFTGLTMFVLLILSVVIFYFERRDRPSQKRNHALLIYALIFSLTIAMLKILSLFQQMDISYVGLIAPAAMGPMIIKLLLNERISIITSMIFAVCGSIIFNEGVTGTFNFTIGIYYLAGCLAGVLFLREHNMRTRILQTGLFIAMINIITIFALLLMRNGSYSNMEIGFYIGMAAVSGIVSSVLTIGILPFFETGFGILSTMRLIELSNPNHPLLRKILTETPGSYHHSVMVANLSDSACEAIGANGLLARVGAYYHDIGKTKRPRYFIENQMNIENPHNKLSPQLSRNIIFAHVSDGVDMLKKHKMPKEIIDIAEQHHGTSLLKFFYHKATEKSDQVFEEEFRYPGPKPQTKEIAIISIADSVEAAVRSLNNPTPEKIEKLVKGIISDKLQDGQLDECDLTLKELDIAAQTFCETLKGIFHSRIEYPELTKQKVKQA
ncbi:HDIG domain-containing protein [Bacillus lacus]|uniref:HDIG domain-containing protein n=1 Tax=Metabacillus lacus TaxID=1983721 RepID=A0A7X2IX56_9BACI|nr:HD family phosphohydrolase [Metabacillus lacus]MRX71306.1 HDIG domain-containing protein [Metabacillus lacus]